MPARSLLPRQSPILVADYESYLYDKNGNRTSYRKRDGRTLTYAYDVLDRVTSKIVPQGCAPIAPTPAPPCPSTQATRDLYYAYDLRGLQLSARFDGATGADLVSATYDGFGRQLSSTTSMAGITRTLAYRWDADGNRIRVTHPDGVYFTTDYDGLDRAVTTKQNGTSVIDTEAYNARGLQSGRFGGLETWAYDAPGRLQTLALALPGSANDLTLGFGYNPSDQVVTRTRSNDLYAYSGYANATQAYAPNGLNQYATVAGTAYRYDASGNLVSDGASTYTWDAENRLVAATGATTQTLVYDALGRLYRASGPGQPNERFLYDGDQLVGEYDPAGATLRRYVHGSGADDPLAWYEGASVTDANRRLLFADHQGSIVAVTDKDGTLIHANSYDDYGNPAAANIGRFGFTGQAWLPGLKLYYYKARLYDPGDGRFLQTDPVGYDDQVNLYAYVGNDPVNGSDPTGEAESETESSKPDTGCTGSHIDCGGGIAPGFSNSCSGSCAPTYSGPDKAANATTSGKAAPPQGACSECVLMALFPATRLIKLILTAQSLLVPKEIISLDKILKNPNLLRGKSGSEIQKVIGPNVPGWKVGPLRGGDGVKWQKLGSKGEVSGIEIRYNPSSTQHPEAGPYWRVNTGHGQTPIIPGR